MRQRGEDARRMVVFWTATALIALDTVLYSMVVPALPVFAARDGFSDSVAALIVAAFPVGQIGTAILAAGLVDRVGRRPVMLVALCALAAATLLFALAQGAPALAAARLVQGAAAGFVWTAGLAAISDVYPASRLGFRIGLAETAGGAVGLLGPAVGGALIDAAGTTATFASASLLPAVAVVPVLRMPETRRRTAGAGHLMSAFARVAARPRARAAAVSLVTLAAVLALTEPLLPLDLDARLGLSPTEIGLVFGAGLLAYFICTPLAGRFSDRHGRRAPTLLGGAAVAVALPFTALGPAPAVALAYGAVGAGLAALGASSGALMVEAVDEAGLGGRYGVSSAMLTIVFSLGYLLGPLFGAVSAMALPYLATTIIASGLVALATSASARILPHAGPGGPGLATGPKGAYGAP